MKSPDSLPGFGYTICCLLWCTSLHLFLQALDFQLFLPQASLKRHFLSKCASGAEKFVPLILM